VKAVAGVFISSADAREVVRKLRAMGLPEDKLAVLLPGSLDHGAKVPVTAAEQPGIAKALAGTVGAAIGAAGGMELGMALTVVLAGVGPILVGGFLGAAILGVLGAGVGVAAGAKLEAFMSEGLPEDEIYVYEDALRQGRSVLIALAADDRGAEAIRGVMRQHEVETIDAARERWWIGLRDAEKEHYDGTGGTFQRDEIFYRRGFQAALYARTRGKEYDQVLNEMALDIEDLQKQYPGSEVEEPFRRGYERGRAHFEAIRTQSTLQATRH
jgi:hypothetical protein